jgi:hypothetical protein
VFYPDQFPPVALAAPWWRLLLGPADRTEGHDAPAGDARPPDPPPERRGDDGVPR